MSDEAINWSVVIAEYLGENDILTGYDVFSDVNPRRKYEGKGTIEIGLETTDSTTFLDGSARQRYNYRVFIRNKRFEDVQIAVRVVATDVKRLLNTERRSGTLQSFTITELGIENDVIGMTAGASFTGYLKVTIDEGIVTI